MKKEIVDNKTLYLIRTLSRTKRKDYENYVINAIWNKLDNDKIEVISQQYIIDNNPQSKRSHYFIDLYFPALNIGIECDEAFHKHQEQRDNEREISIYDVLHEINSDGYMAFHIDVTKSFNDVQMQINDVVKKIKLKIAAGTDIKEWNVESTKEYYNGKKEVSVYDRKGFKTINEVCNILFSAGRSEESQGPSRSYFSLPIFKNTILEGHKIWFPKIAVKDSDGNLVAATSKGWNNQLINGGKTIIEKNDIKDLDDKHDRKKRITFAKYKDPLGDSAYKFVGIFDLENIDHNGTRHYKRINDKCIIINKSNS